MQRRKHNRVTMTAAQRATTAGSDLLELLVDIVADGELTDAEIERLGYWLADNEDATDVPAVVFLRDLVARIVDDAVIDHEERLDLAVAIERVLPKELRLLAKERRADAELVNPPLATAAQVRYLISLGGIASATMTKEQASDELDRLIGSRSSVSNRQMMVLRFWDCVAIAGRGRYGVSEWMDDFYTEDGDRPAAWEWWKEDNLDCGRQDPPEKVPIGIGTVYLARVKQRAAGLS